MYLNDINYKESHIFYKITNKDILVTKAKDKACVNYHSKGYDKLVK